MYDTYGKSALEPEIIWNHLAWPIFDSPIRITETTSIGRRKIVLRFVVCLTIFYASVFPTSLISKFTSESQKVEEFAAIGFLIAQEIAHFLYTDKTSELFVSEIENFKTHMEINLLDPAYTKKPNIYPIQLDEEVNF